MSQKKSIKLLSVLVALSLLITAIPSAAVRIQAVSDGETLRLDEDCLILDYVHEDVFNEGDHIARLKEEETLDSYVFLNRDGSKTAYFLDQPVKYLDSTGAVREKNVNLVADLSGYQTSQNDIQLHIPTKATSGIQLSYDGYEVTIIPQGGAADPAGLRSENSVGYPNFYGSGSALVYTPTLSGVKEDIILARYTGVSDFTFLLNTDGLNLYHTSEDRYYLAQTEDAEMKIWLGNIEIFDASAKPSMGTLTVETVTAGQQYRLTVSADEAFLTDPDTVYPVTIDPSITVSDNAGANSIEDAPIYEGYPTSNFGSYQYNRAGYGGTAYKRGRTVVRLTGLLYNSTFASLTDSAVSSAKFYISDGSGTSASTVNLYPLSSSSWTESGVTWNNVSGYSTSYSASASVGGGNFASFDITNLVRAWKRDEYGGGENGFILIGASESSVDRALYSSEHSTTAKRPYVVLDYTVNTGSMVSSIDVDMGDTYQLSVSGMSGTITWSSADPSVASVSSSGLVTGVTAGVTTITASASGYTPKTCTVYVTIEDGVYYIKNASSARYLAAKDGCILNQTNVIQSAKVSTDPDRLSQLWKINYLSDGYYSIRPMHKLDMGLNVTSGNVDIASIGTTDTLSGVSSGARWKIQYDTNGYVFFNGGSYTKAMYPQGGASTAGTSIIATTYSSGNSAFRWTVDRVTNVPNQIHVYNSETGLLDDNAVRLIKPNQTLSLQSLGIAVCVTSCNSNDQTVTWGPSVSQIASVNSSTGTVTAGSAKCRATTITASALGVSATYIICVTPVTLQAQPNDYWCWLATARMLAMNYSETLDYTMEAAAVELGVTEQDSGNTTKIHIAARLFSSAVPELYSTIPYNSFTSPVDVALKNDALISSLNQGHAVAVNIRYYPSLEGHAVLIAGYANVNDEYIFIIFDPGPEREGRVYTATYEQIRMGTFEQNSPHVWSGGVLADSIGGISGIWEEVTILNPNLE